MPIGVGTALAISGGLKLGSSLINRGREKKRSRNRRRFFDSQISPLLDETTQDIDVDFGSIYDAEMQMPMLQFQNQIEGITRGRDQSAFASGFSDSGFRNRDYSLQMETAGGQLDAQKFNTQRGIIDLQSQLESMVNQNKIRAKELEYQYKYG